MSLTRLRGVLVTTCIVLLPCVAAAQQRADPQAQAGWLGVMLEKTAGPTLDGEEPDGVPVLFVVEDGPAARAGLRSSDRILSVDGTLVQTSRELLAALQRESPGDWVPLTISRRGEERDVRVRLEQRPTDRRKMRVRRGSIGIETIELPPALRQHFGAPADAGAMISQIEPGSPAEAAGLELGDVIFEVDGAPVESTSRLERMIETGGVGNKLEFKLARWGSEIIVEALVGLKPADSD